jgi:hypothetical protein
VGTLRVAATAASALEEFAVSLEGKSDKVYRMTADAGHVH